MSIAHYIPLKDAAARLGVHKETLRRAVLNNKLQAVHLGRTFQTTEEWLQEYLDGQKVQTMKEDEDSNGN